MLILDILLDFIFDEAIHKTYSIVEHRWRNNTHVVTWYEVSKRINHRREVETMKKDCKKIGHAIENFEPRDFSI